MAFRIQDVTVHLLAAGAPGACTCGPASPIERPNCPAASGPKNPPGPKPPNKPKDGGRPKPVEGPKRKGALAFLKDQLREAMAPPAP